MAKSLFTGSNMNMDVESLDFSPEKIGNILLRQSILDREQLEQALLQQQLNPELRLGEILVRNNLLSLSQLKFYLKNQNVKLGQLLIEKKIIKQDNLQELLALQNNADNRLGRIIIERKNIPQTQIEDILIEQYLRRKGLFLADPTHYEELTRRSLDLTVTSQSLKL